MKMYALVAEKCNSLSHFVNIVYNCFLIMYCIVSYCVLYCILLCIVLYLIVYCIVSYCVLCLYLICYLYTNVSTKVTRNKHIH